MSTAFSFMPSSPSLSPSPRESWRSSRSLSAARRMNPSKFIGWRPRRRPSRSRSHSRSPNRWNNNGWSNKRHPNGRCSNNRNNIRNSPLNGTAGPGRDSWSSDGKSNRLTGALPPQSELFAQDIQQRQRPVNLDRSFNRNRRVSRASRRRSRSPMTRYRAHDKHRHPRLQSPQCLPTREIQQQSIAAITAHAERPQESTEFLGVPNIDVPSKDVRSPENCYALIRNLPANLDWDHVLQMFSRFHATEVCYACDGWRVTFSDFINRDAAVREMNGSEWQSRYIFVTPWAAPVHSKDDCIDEQIPDDQELSVSDNCIGFIFEALLQTSVEQAWRDIIEAPVFRYLEEWSGKPRSSPQAAAAAAERCDEISLSNHDDADNFFNISYRDASSTYNRMHSTAGPELCSTHSDSKACGFLSADLTTDAIPSIAHVDLDTNQSMPSAQNNLGELTTAAESFMKDVSYFPTKSELLTEHSSATPGGLLTDTELSSNHLSTTTDSTSVAELTAVAGESIQFPTGDSSSAKSAPVKNKRGRPPGSKSNHSAKTDPSKRTSIKCGNPICLFCGADDDQDQIAKCWSNSCHSALHIYCMAPPLRRVPRQWACDNHVIPDSSSAAANFDEDEDEEYEYETREWRPSGRLREQPEVRLNNSPSHNVVGSNSVPAHQYGCARTAGISLHLMHKQSRSTSLRSTLFHADSSSNSRRGNRADRRRLSAAISSSAIPPLQLNSLVSRDKNLQLFRSGIHAWGVRTCEPLYDGDLVIEYIGECISACVADVREKRYERVGIGSSYFFKIDDDLIIDATKKGNLARYINHSCTPNCKAKVVTVGNTRRIAIYAKQFIPAGEELCYDYKFSSEPEEDKIPCWCGTKRCRGFLN